MRYNPRLVEKLARQKKDFLLGALSVFSLILAGCSPSGGSTEGKEASSPVSPSTPSPTPPTQSPSSGQNFEVSADGSHIILKGERASLLGNFKLKTFAEVLNYAEPIEKKLELLNSGTTNPNGTTTGISKLVNTEDLLAIEKEVDGFTHLLNTKLGELAKLMEVYGESDQILQGTTGDFARFILIHRDLVRSLISLRVLARERNPEITLESSVYDFSRRFTVRVPVMVAMNLPFMNYEVDDRFPRKSRSLSFDWSRAKEDKVVNVQLSLWFIHGVVEGQRIYKQNIDKKALFELTQFLAIQQLQDNLKVICRRRGQKSEECRPGELNKTFSAQYSALKVMPEMIREDSILAKESSFRRALLELINKEYSQLPPFITDEYLSSFFDELIKEIPEITADDKKMQMDNARLQLNEGFRIDFPENFSNILKNHEYVFSGTTRKLREEMLLKTIVEAQFETAKVRLMLKSPFLARQRPSAIAAMKDDSQKAAAMERNKKLAPLIYRLEQSLEEQKAAYRKRLNLDAEDFLERSNVLALENEEKDLRKSDFPYHIVKAAEDYKNDSALQPLSMPQAISSALANSKLHLGKSVRLSPWLVDLGLDKTNPLKPQPRTYLGAREVFFSRFYELIDPKLLDPTNPAESALKFVEGHEAIADSNIKDKYDQRIATSQATILKDEVKAWVGVGKELRFFDPVTAQRQSINAATVFKYNPAALSSYRAAQQEAQFEAEPFLNMPLKTGRGTEFTELSNGTHPLHEVILEAKKFPGMLTKVVTKALEIQEIETRANIQKISALTSDKNYELDGLLKSAILRRMILEGFPEYQKPMKEFIDGLSDKDPFEVFTRDYVQQVLQPVNAGLWALLIVDAARLGTRRFVGRSNMWIIAAEGFSRGVSHLGGTVLKAIIPLIAINMYYDGRDYFSRHKVELNLANDLQQSSLTNSSFYNISALAVFQDEAKSSALRLFIPGVIFTGLGGYGLYKLVSLRLGAPGKLYEWLLQTKSSFQRLAVKEGEWDVAQINEQARILSDLAKARNAQADATAIEQARNFLIEQINLGKTYRVDALLAEKSTGLTSWETKLWKLGRDQEANIRQQKLVEFYQERY